MNPKTGFIPRRHGDTEEVIKCIRVLPGTLLVSEIDDVFSRNSRFFLSSCLCVSVVDAFSRMNGLWRPTLVASLFLLTTACGRKGALVYPDMLVPAAPTVTTQQSGSAVKLQFSIPDKDKTGKSIQGVAGLKISRRAVDVARKDVCRSCTADYLLLRTLYLDLLPSDTQRFGSHLLLLDHDVSVGTAYSYRALPFMKDGVEGTLSAAAEVRVGTLLPAPTVNIESLPTEVRLQLTQSSDNTGTSLGFNVYRSAGRAARSYLPLNREPVKGNRYVDTTLERGVTYHYRATAVIVQESGSVAESAESGEVEGTLKDDIE